MTTTFVILGLLILVVSFVGGFDTWISIIGGVGVNLTAFIFPPFFYIKKTRKKSNNMILRVAWTMFVLGWISMVLDLFGTFYTLFGGKT